MENHSTYPWIISVENIIIYAVKYVGEDGWHIHETSCLDESLKQDGEEGTISSHNIIQVATINGYGQTHKVSADRVGSWGESIANDAGWTFDSISGLFRSPEETLLLPYSSPNIAHKFSVAISPPRNGWTTTTIRTGSESYAFQCSYVFDPFPKMLHWLEEVASQNESRLQVNEEGSYTSMSIYNVYQNTIRVVVRIHRLFECIEMDFIVEREVFLKAVYESILLFDLEVKKRTEDWVFFGYEDSAAVYLELRSSLLEKYLYNID